MSHVARIFKEVDGRYYVCSEKSELLDARGTGHLTKRQAMIAALRDGYTYGIGSGTYSRWQPKPLKAMVGRIN